MIVSFALFAQVTGLGCLSQSLCSGPMKLTTCAAVAACAAFEASIIVNLQSALGMLVFGVWLIGSVVQAGCLLAVLAKPNASKNQAVTVASLVVTNCMNVWFGLEFFNAVG